MEAHDQMDYIEEVLDRMGQLHHFATAADVTRAVEMQALSQEIHLDADMLDEYVEMALVWQRDEAADQGQHDIALQLAEMLGPMT